MKNAKNTNKNSVIVTIILTESAKSLLKLSVPHLEHLHPENSKICLITPGEFNKIPKQNVDNRGEASTSKNDKECKEVEQLHFQISSDTALFSTSNCSSSSCMYELSDDNLTQSRSYQSKESGDLFKSTKISNNPLVTVRSMAHSNKLNVFANDIYVSLLDKDSSGSSDFICRICHGGESLDDLLTPCRCRGTIALVHLKCLERWLKESNHSSCELCQHHYKIIREPKYIQYSVAWSIFVFLRHPGDHLQEILLDLLAFIIYTPSAVASTYMLMMICEALIKSNIVTNGSLSSHIVAFSSVFGMAAIDFTYSSWLMVTIQKHIDAWREWYRSNSALRVVLPKIKLRPQKFKKKHKKKTETPNSSM